MKSLLFLVFLCLAIAAGGAVFYAANVSKREAKVLGWANSLVWERLGMPHDIRVRAVAAVQDEDRPQLWQIDGQLEKSAGTPDESYRAIVERVCSSIERRCWRLAELEIAGKTVGLEIQRLTGEAELLSQEEAGTNGAAAEAPRAPIEAAGMAPSGEKARGAEQEAAATPAVQAPTRTADGPEAVDTPPLPDGLSSGLGDLRLYPVDPPLPPLPRRRP